MAAVAAVQFNSQELNEIQVEIERIENEIDRNAPYYGRGDGHIKLLQSELVKLEQKKHMLQYGRPQ